jgi:hypothetical protein
MKEANPAPMFACLYPALCDIARQNGYALAIHGSVTSDLDLIAVPWTETACEAENLMQAIMQKLGALNYRQLLERDCASWAKESDIDQMVIGERECNGDPRGPLDCAMKPHGRKAWNLYLLHGVKIDLSIMPL